MVEAHLPETAKNIEIPALIHYLIYLFIIIIN